MTRVGFATLDVIPSLKGVQSSIEKQSAAGLVAAGKTGGKKYGDALGASANSAFKTHLKSLATLAGGAAVGRGVFEFFKGSIEGASDLAETTSKLRVIFGDASDEVEAFAKDSTKNLLLTEQAADDAAATFGIFGKSAGLTGSALAGFSTEMTSLASDLSSFNNTSTDDAVTALGAALRGESEPIRAYGVLLDDATLKQEALEQGLITTTKNALTPQQRVLAAHAQILKQTVDAQGDAARTQDGYANSVRILQKSFQELQTEVGEQLLPALTETVHFLNEDGVPALKATGGAIGETVGFFRDLPAPVQAATAALVAFKAAQRFGVTDGIGRGVTATTGALTTVRSRLAETAATWREYRSAQIVAVDQGHKFIDSSGRITSGLASIKTLSRGAGSALKAGLGGALGLVGGPWGAAFIAGTAVLTHFWQENKESKARVDALTESLNKQTGAITKKTKAQVFDDLQQSGAIKLANELGVSLTDVRDAALGSRDAQARLAAQFDRGAQAIAANSDAGSSASKLAADYRAKADLLTNAIGGQNSELAQSKQAFKDQAEFMGKGAAVTDDAKVSMREYGDEILEAKNQLNLLIEAEKERADNAVQQRRDHLALISTIKDVEKEARKGKQTLDENTAAGRNNLGALLDLADQWNNSTPKVQNAQGAYQNLRNEFIKLADQMNGPDGTRKDAIKLADSLLAVPKNVPIEFQSKGFKERMHEIAALKLAAQGITSTVDFDPLRPDHPTHTAPSTSGGKGGGGTTPRVIAVTNNYNVNTIGDAQKFDLHKRQQVGMGGFG